MRLHHRPPPTTLQDGIDQMVDHLEGYWDILTGRPDRHLPRRSPELPERTVIDVEWRIVGENPCK